MYPPLKVRKGVIQRKKRLKNNCKLRDACLDMK